MIRGARSRLALFGLACAALSASCALSFPDDYEVDGATSSGGAGAGGDHGGGPLLSDDGAACTSSGECKSGHCLPSNTKEGSVCCADACPDLGADSCSTNGKCDAGGGSCALYPAGTVCGGTTCQDGMLIEEQCQAGACGPSELVPCPGGFSCDDATTCKAECATAADCANEGATCLGSPGACIQPVGAPCDGDAQCLTGICGVTGAGHCCSLSAFCQTAGPCGATDCDANGDCLYPGEETACGSSATCANGTLTSRRCDGAGACGSDPTPEPCPGHLDCDTATTCYPSCGSNDASGDERCADGYWCDGATCLPAAWQGGAACERNGQCCSGNCTLAGCWLWTPCN